MAEPSGPLLQVHIEPGEPIEVPELTAALGSLARQYQDFAGLDETFGRPSEARLLVSSVSHGSIDIALLPDWASVASLMVPTINHVGHLVKFAEHIKRLIQLFSADRASPPTEVITVKDCDDAANIVRPTATHGGVQNFTVINIPKPVVVLTVTAKEAQKVLQSATREKSRLQRLEGAAETRKGVSLVWTQLARDIVKTKGATSPDKGLIQEIDSKPHAVLFTDETAHLKREMIEDEENPYKKVYFVDVEVSRVERKVTAFRVVGYHGKDDLPDPNDTSA